jgi:hypothetical protein
MPHAPLLLDADAHAKRPAWMNDVTAYHNRGDIDFESCDEQCFEQGDFYGLDDLFTEQPRVVNGLAQLYGRWIRRFKVDGFRIDTARHVDAAFFHVWVPKIRRAARAAGVPRFQMFGEIFLTSAVDVAPFVRDRGLPNVLDFPFQDAATNFASGASSARALAHRLDDDDYFRTPRGVEPVPATFLGNHDLGRAAQQIKSRGGNLTGNDLLQRVLLGYDVLYLLRGAPTVYYGDEVGMIGSGGDRAARQDMFPTEVAEWQTEERVGSRPIGKRSSLDIENNPIEVRLRRLAELRDANPALWRGLSIVRLATGPALVVSRIDPRTRREVVVGFNSGTTLQRVKVRTASHGPWVILAGAGAAGTGRRLTLAIDPRGTTVARGGRAPSPAELPTPTITAAPDDLTNLLALRAHVAVRAPLSVAFAIRRDGGRWARVAVDDTPPYRGFVSPSSFGKGERVDAIAVARSLGGATAVSKIVAVRARR